MRVALITTFPSHYSARTFETLSRHHEVDYFFFSRPELEWYWLPEHGMTGGRFHQRYLPGFSLGHTRLTPSLVPELYRGHYDAYIKCIHGRFALPATFLAARAARRPILLWTGLWNRVGTPAHRLFFPLTSYLYRHADALIVYGEHVRRYLESEGVAPERIFVAPHAVDNALYGRPVAEAEVEGLRRELGVEPGQKIVLYLGRLVDEKGLEYLVRAFASLHRGDAVLVLAGAGAARERLADEVRRVGIEDRVRFPGYVPQARTVAYYAAAWVYVLPSITTPTFKEPWGLVVNEACNQGLPVIATDAVGAAAGGLVRDRETGRVVPERDVDALAAALAEILDDAALREQLGAAAREAVRRFGLEEMVAGFRRALDFVADRRG
jgi:glycosyltransferase involved in cell wall biosynthesis